MKRKNGTKDGKKKKVRFADVECEIMPNPEAEEAMDSSHETEPQMEGTGKETDWVEDVRTAEIPISVVADLDDGDVPLEPFNLDEEREFGIFGEDDFYVENKPDPSDVKDAWLSSSEATVCSIEVLRRHQKQQEAMEAADKAPKGGISENLELQSQIVELLKPRETILMALRRTGRKKKSKDDPERDMETFEKLTELADALLNAGEIDAYSLYREEFQHALESMGHGKKPKETTDPGTNDMFAEESDEEGAKKSTDNKT